MSEETIQLTLPDGSVREAARGSTGLELAHSIGKKLGKDAVGLLLDGELCDVRTPLQRDGAIRILTRSDPEGLEVLRHSMAHAMAQAILKLYPNASLAIGPTVTDGFYYDVDVDTPLTPDDLKKIEKEMARVVKADLALEKYILSREEALAWAEEHGQQFKVEIISDLPEDEEISFYRQGDFTDLCSGPHMQRTGKLGRAFKLMRVAGAYWRGDEKREQLQRIYGTAWFSQEDLDEHLHLLEEAKKRDHRRLGKDLELFMFHENAPAMPFFLPKGAFLYNQLVDHVRDLYTHHGYDEVITPLVLDVDLWHRSGHYDHYRDNMYFTRFDADVQAGEAAGEATSAVKPMNCPTHCLLFQSKKRSYRDLPIRFADFGRLHRYERSGVTAGLFRVRSFAQDDAHIFCTQDQIEPEVTGVVKMILECYRMFGFDDIQIDLSLRPEKAQGSEQDWERATAALESALKKMGVEYQAVPGEGAFYGPKIDFSVRDSLKRRWQLGTCQLDFSMPARFDLKYTAASGEDEMPVMVHRAMLGSLERFLGVYIEHVGGNFPLWLAPVQAVVLSITDTHKERVEEIATLLHEASFRVRTDTRNEKIGLKVREASLAKVRYLLIIGDRELEQGTVAVRDRVDGDLGAKSLEEFQELLRRQIDDRL